MPLTFFDTHTHLNFPDFPDIQKTLDAAHVAGVSKMMVVACELPSSQNAVELALAYDGLYASVGLHPTEAHRVDLNYVQKLHALAFQNSKVVAIGETGLDYYHKEAPVEAQKKVFREQISLAKELNLPLIIHMREAEADLLALLRTEGVKRAVIHCFSASMQVAEECLELGLMLSFTGIVTYPKALEIQKVAATVPLDRIMIETDCPYLTPEKYRGELNQPAYVVEVAQKIAELRGIPLEEVAEQTTKNAERFFEV